MYQLSPPGPTAPPLKFRASILPESAGEPLRLDQRYCPKSSIGITRIYGVYNPSSVPPGSSPPGSLTGCVDASPLASRRYIPPPRPTATLISCHAWGFQPRIGTWHVHTRLLRNPEVSRPPLPVLSPSRVKFFPMPHHWLAPGESPLTHAGGAEAPAYAWAPTVAGRRNKEFLRGFPCLPDVLFADVLRGPTNTSRLRLAPGHPYAPVGCTTYAHIDPAKAALRAGSYQWEIREDQVDRVG